MKRRMLRPMTDSDDSFFDYERKCSSCGRGEGKIVPTDILPGLETMVHFVVFGERYIRVPREKCDQCESLIKLPCARGHVDQIECYRICYPTVPDPAPWKSRLLSSQPGPAPRTPISAKVRRAVFERDHYTCQACGARGDQRGVQLTIDHKKPLKRGGTNEMSNLQTLCSKCNTTKGTKNTGYGDSVDE